MVVARPVRPGAGSRDSRSSSPWPCQAAIFCRPASSRASSSVSSWAEPRCSTIRCIPSSLTAICTAVTPEEVQEMAAWLVEQKRARILVGPAD